MKLMFHVAVILCLGFATTVAISQSVQIPYSKVSLIPNPSDHITPEFNHASRFRDISKYFSPAIEILSGYKHLYNPDIHRINNNGNYFYRMYIFGWFNTICNQGFPGCDAIFMLDSEELTRWEIKQKKDTWKPILSAGNNIWNQWHIGDPSVLQIDNMHVMAYSSSGFDKDNINPHPDKNFSPNYEEDIDEFYYTISGAYSADGVHWTNMKYPILSTPNELGKKDYASNATFHRPSLMYDLDRFKMWFDYVQTDDNNFHSMGYAELIGPATLETFLSYNWIIKKGMDSPALPNWPNPEVVKLPFGYISFADPREHDGGEWLGRKTSVAFSGNGIDWKILGFLEPDADCDANHVPETLVEADQLHLITACMVNLEYTSLKMRSISLKTLEDLTKYLQ